MSLTRTSCFSIILLLCGCALSPQVITISPPLDTSGKNMRQPTNAITIRVNDARPGAVLGSRGGVYSETALLTTADNMTQTLQESLASALRGLGYSITANSPRTLTVDVLELSYSNQRNNALYTVSTGASVRVICANNRNTLNNDYKITNKKDFVKTPSQNENERIVNATLASALNRIFNDDKFLECLDG